jgi:Transposase DDE domain
VVPFHCRDGAIVSETTSLMVVHWMYSNGEQAEACEAKGILPHVPANRGVNSRGDGTLFDRTEFTYQPESDTFLCPVGQTLARKQLMRKDRAVLYAAQPEVCGACPLKSRCTVSSRRIVTRYLHEEALQRMQQRAAPEAMRLRRATAEHSIRQFEIPHLRTSSLPAAWTARGANGNQSGRIRLQSEAHGEHSRRTQATCSPAGHLILLPPVVTRRLRDSPRQNKKAMLRHSEHRSKSLYHSRFVTV